MTRFRVTVVVCALMTVAMLIPPPANAAEDLPTAFPDDFPVPVDASLHEPVIGFGADGAVRRTPVILLHGNNDTPFPTECNNAYGRIHALASYLHDHGYSASELWGLGYQGDQCDLMTEPSARSAEAHTTVANRPDLDAFVRAVLDYTGAQRVDIVGHSLGATLAREWMRYAGTHHLVRRLISIDGPNHGIVNCSPDPRNYWQAPALGGFHPESAICREYGAADTPFLSRLNDEETPGPTRYLAIGNVDTSFVFFDRQDGAVPPVPAQDRKGRPHDFSQSARLEGGVNVEVTGQGRYDPWLGSAHLGVVNSPDVWRITREFLGGAGNRPNP